jgi:hypothetical protein
MVFAPCGEGTGVIEQLGSLAVRYAERCSVYFIDLYREKLIPLIREGRGGPQRITIARNVIVDGSLGAANTWATAMNRALCRTDLRRCTLLPWRHVLAPRGLARVSRAWCPVCLEEWRTADAAVYEPLVWRLNAVVACPHHRVRLSTSCPACGSGQQPAFAANARVGCCRKCGAWVGRIEAPAESREPTDFDLFCAQSCEQMLALSSSVDESRLLSSDIVVRAVRDVFFMGNGSEMAQALGHLRSQVNHYCVGTFPAPLNLFLRAAFVTGATMEQLFVTNIFAEGGCATAMEFDLHRARSRRVLTDEELRVRLEGELSGAEASSVREVANRLNLEPGLIWRRAPDLAASISRRHAAYVAQTSADRKEHFILQLTRLTDEYRRLGHAPTVAQIKEALGGHGCFINSWKRSLITGAMDEAFGGIAAATADLD